jgi:CheY-like chemotaxis protein
MLPRNTGSPADALGWIRRGDPFDVALIDLQMPEMDGIELTTEIRRCRDADQLPVVMLSSFGQRVMQASASALEGLDLAAYLLKPIKPSQLYNALVGIFGVEEASPDLEKSERIQFDVEFGKRHPLSILLAEDNAVNQKLALLMLERLGYRADVAGNGLEVLQALRRRRYDVVFMDVQMPEIDGLEATRAIVQKYGVKRRPRIVAMTANVMKEDRDECFAAGMDDFIPKPIQLAALVAALNRCPPRTVTELADTKHPAELPAPVASEAGIGPDLQPTAAAEPAPPVLDPAALQRLRSTLGQQADKMLPSLIDSFFKDAPRLIGDAQRFLEHGQPADLRRAAHSLKSTSATFGAMVLSALARELEYKARDEALEGAEDLLRRIQSEYAQAQVALEKVRKE